MKALLSLQGKELNKSLIKVVFYWWFTVYLKEVQFTSCVFSICFLYFSNFSLIKGYFRRKEKSFFLSLTVRQSLSIQCYEIRISIKRFANVYSDKWYFIFNEKSPTKAWTFLWLQIYVFSPYHISMVCHSWFDYYSNQKYLRSTPIGKPFTVSMFLFCSLPKQN